MRKMPVVITAALALMFSISLTSHQALADQTIKLPPAAKVQSAAILR